MYTVLLRADTGRGGDKTMNLIKEQIERLGRLEALQAHISDQNNKINFISRPDKVKITSDQVKKVKRLLDAGVSMVDIQNTTGLSEYHVRGVRRGRYDSLLE